MCFHVMCPFEELEGRGAFLMPFWRRGDDEGERKGMRIKDRQRRRGEGRCRQRRGEEGRG